ncbi:RNA-directed DNA polymerase, eukaryota [Tanacetum coccineum]
MNAVPPPITGIFMPSSNQPDIDESKMTYGKKSCESIPAEESLPKPAVIEPKTSENVVLFGRHLEEIYVTMTQFGRKRDKNATLHEDVQEIAYSSREYERLVGKRTPPVVGWKNASATMLSVLKGNNLPHVISPSPAMVLDESCIVSRDLDLFMMGEAKNILSIPNLYILLSNEGFHNVKLSYLGGLWVMIELESINSKEKFMQHSGVASWFSNLCNAQLDFVSRNRIVWVDIEGVPIHAWSRATFNKIGSKWGEVMEIEECKDDLFARKRICIKTSQEDNILEKFKIIVKGKVFVIRAKELFVWSPVFKVDNEATFFSDAESSKGSDEGKGDDVNKDMESDGEAVSDTYFGENSDNLNKEHDQVLSPKVVVSSPDPFNIYETLRKKSDKVLHNEPDSSIPFPPGFTPRNDNLNVDDQVVKDKTPVLSQRQSEGFCSRVMEDLHQDADHSFSDNNSIGNKGRDSRKGGSILDVLDGMVKVGQAMGYDMDGCLKDMEKIIGSQGVPDVNFISLQETKLESISSMDVKFIWGNSRFDHISSDALGNSGGILCIWDPNVFSKDYHIISDNFIAIAGTWIPSNSNLLIISVYAPQPRVEKRLLWNYISSLITHWQGDALVLGDFNEVRNTEERRGSVFNLYGAADFNEFISSSGLIDIMLEGYSFTWSHPSACKMSKLDRFLVTEGFLSVFPHCSAICLDRHLSDHRPILLRELQVDYGATPFRFYHSWLNISGFDLMVSQTWNSLSFNDSNDMIRFKKKLQALKKYIRECIIVHWFAE